MRKFRFPLLVTLLLFGALAFTACGDDDDDDGAAPTAAATEAAAPTEAATDDQAGGSITVTLTDFAIAISGDTDAGDVQFVVANTGGTPHELAIVKSDLAADALPVDGGAVDESQVDVVGRIAQFDANSSQTDTFSLDSGSYVLICNIPGHYQLGMTLAFTVQ